MRDHLNYFKIVSVTADTQNIANNDKKKKEKLELIKTN